MRRGILHVGGQSECGDVEPVSHERIAVKVREGVAVAEGYQHCGAKCVVDLGHHRLSSGSARTAGEVGRVVVSEQVRIGSVVASISVSAAYPSSLTEIVIAPDADLM